MIDMLIKVREESGYPEMVIDDSYYENLINEYSNSPDKCLFVEHNKGFIAGLKSNNLMALPNVLVALQVFWYVLPEYRKTGVGIDLYNQFEKWATENKCVYIMQEFPTKGCFKVNKNYMRELN